MLSLLSEKWRVKNYGAHSFSGSVKWKIAFTLFREVKSEIKMAWDRVQGVCGDWTKLRLPNPNQTAASKSRPNIRNQSQNLDQNSASKSRPNLSLKLLTKLQLQILDQTFSRLFLDQMNFPGKTVDFHREHVLHILFYFMRSISAFWFSAGLGWHRISWERQKEWKLYIWGFMS